jgi:hypothetical protein
MHGYSAAKATSIAQRIGKYRTALGVPLLREGVPIGVLAITRSSVRPFSDKQIELATTFADQAVIAIENVRLFDEVQARTRELTESLEQQTATSEILGVISRSPGELKPVFETMLANATRLCEAEFGTLVLYEGDACRHVADHGDREHPPTQRTARVVGAVRAVAIRHKHAADCDFGGSASHLKLSRRVEARLRGHAGERNTTVRGELWRPVA